MITKLCFDSCGFLRASRILLPLFPPTLPSLLRLPLASHLRPRRFRQASRWCYNLYWDHVEELQFATRPADSPHKEEDVRRKFLLQASNAALRRLKLKTGTNFEKPDAEVLKTRSLLGNLTLEWGSTSSPVCDPALISASLTEFRGLFEVQTKPTQELVQILLSFFS